MRLHSPPLGLKWRSSFSFTTFVVGLGIATDLVVYSIVVPVVPFQLERLGYHSVSALAGWLLFAYVRGLVICTIPIAMFSERYQIRRMPLILGLFLLVGSQIMFMEAPNFAVMCVARVLQGSGSTMIWVVGLSLLCDCTPEEHIGRQLGIAMIGMSVGFLAGPPIGGALYGRWGWRAPFIFGVIMAVFDLVGRLLIIERKDALRWTVDPPAEEEKPASETPSNIENVSLVGVIVRLCKSSRAVVALTLTLLFGLIYSAQEPTLPLHLQDVWGLDPAKVGLIYIASVVPTLFSAPISGFYTDRIGVEWLSCICFALSVPWWVVLIVKRSLALFIVALALGSFFISGILSPLMAELAAVARQIDGVGCKWIFLAVLLSDQHRWTRLWSIQFSLRHRYDAGTCRRRTASSAIGVAGRLGLIFLQMYTHLRNGWEAIMGLSAGLLVLCCGLTFVYIGDEPLLSRLLRRRKNENRD
ncbi:MFS general substrate transporter [Mycena amicta]|nr:MFS general substrate transporter [Mycena amicta]